MCSVFNGVQFNQKIYSMLIMHSKLQTNTYINFLIGPLILILNCVILCSHLQLWVILTDSQHLRSQSRSLVMILMNNKRLFYLTKLSTFQEFSIMILIFTSETHNDNRPQRHATPANTARNKTFRRIIQRHIFR